MNDTVFDLNGIYRSIIVITGTTPDPLRDYYLDQEIPGLLDRFGDISSRLKALQSQLQALANGEKGNQTFSDYRGFAGQQ